MSTNPYAPAHLSAEELAVERYTYLGLSLSLTAYGTVRFRLTFQSTHCTPGIVGLALLLFLRTGYLLLPQRNKQQEYHNRNVAIGLFVYLCIAFALLTTTTICNAVSKTRAFIDNREFPGGPAAYLKSTYFSTPGAIAVITYVFVDCLTQGLMVCSSFLGE
jgi:hypothetical protein